MTVTLSCEVVVAGGYLYRPEPSYFAAEANQKQLFDGLLGGDSLRRLDVFSQCALFALENARRIADDGQPAAIAEPERQGVCVGTGLGAQVTRVRYARRLAQLGPAATNPIDFPDSIDGAAAAHIAMRWGLRGPSLTFADGPSSAINAITAACRQIAFGRADRIYLAVGDVYEPWVRAAVDAIAAPCRDASPSDAVLALVLERLNLAKQAKHRVHLVGFLDKLDCGSERCRFREVAPSKASEHDFSGALQAAGAWLEVAAPMGTAASSCQDDLVAAVCGRVKPETRSSLAFCRKVDNR